MTLEHTDAEGTVAELQLLQYPLAVGAQWARNTPVNGMAMVEAKETIELPSGSHNAYRIRVSNDDLGPNDSIVYWYDECGLLAFERHTELRAIDAADPTNIIVVATDACQELVDLSITKPGCNAKRAAGL